jgi:hypothetical protein
MIKFLNNQDCDLITIRTNLFSLGINWCDSLNGDFAKLTEDLSMRVILTVNKRKDSDFNNPMIRECNGLVLNYKNTKWTPLVIPIPMFNLNKISMKRLGDLFKSNVYDIYNANDATIINLYYYEDKWRLSSTNGYDITNLIMINNETYWDIFTKIMKNCKHFNLDAISKLKSYSLNLRYSKFHIFNESKYNSKNKKIDYNSYIILLQSVNRETLEINKFDNIGIPIQQPIIVKDNINTLLNYAKHAYSKYEKNIKNTIYKYKPLYGFILRAKNNNVNGEYQNIYIESSLMKIIKNGIYKNSDLLTDDNTNLVLSLYLDRSNSIRYQNILLQFNEEFKKIESILNNIVDIVYIIINKLPQTQENYSSDIKSFIDIILNNNNFKQLPINNECIIDKTLIIDIIHDIKFLIPIRNIYQSTIQKS